MNYDRTSYEIPSTWISYEKCDQMWGTTKKALVYHDYKTDINYLILIQSLWRVVCLGSWKKTTCQLIFQKLRMIHTTRHVTLKWHFRRKCRCRLTFIFVFKNITCPSIYNLNNKWNFTNELVGPDYIRDWILSLNLVSLTSRIHTVNWWIKVITLSSQYHQNYINFIMSIWSAIV